MMEVIVTIAALVIVVLALLGALVYTSVRRRQPDVEVARQITNTLIDAYWSGKQASEGFERPPPHVMPPLQQEQEPAYDPEQDGPRRDEFETPVDVTEAPMRG